MLAWGRGRWAVSQKGMMIHPRVPCKRKANPFKFLSVQKFARTHVNVVSRQWLLDFPPFCLFRFVLVMINESEKHSRWLFFFSFEVARY